VHTIDKTAKSAKKRGDPKRNPFAFALCDLCVLCVAQRNIRRIAVSIANDKLPRLQIHSTGNGDQLSQTTVISFAEELIS
jgi:hypothetical protein